MPLLHESNIAFDLESLNDEEDERCHGLLIRRTTSYATSTNRSSTKTKLSSRQSSDTINVDQAIACALKSHPKSFHYTQKHLQYLPPSIEHLAVCETIREFDLHGNKLKSLPDEIEKLKSIETCNLGKRNLHV
jgi:Leucine-rich repeat (LRR) protein